MLKVLLLSLCLATVLEAKKYCVQDDDCYDLGGLVCIKSACNRGICSCPRGKAAKFMGSQDGYQCVSIKKIGESCSNKGDTGVCGAINSYCNESTLKCTCHEGKVPKSGGEICVDADENVIGETCSPSGIGDRCIDSECRSEVNKGDYWSTDVNFDMPTCACMESEELKFTNSLYGTSSLFFQEFVSAKEPVCVPRMVGSACVRDSDCPDGGNSVTCQSNVCACKTSGQVQDYYGLRCDSSISQGQNCTFVSGHCDGSKGLVCGDQCDPTGTAIPKCLCGPWHTGTATCTAIGEGGSCFGDVNCKGWKLTAVCVDGSCQDGATALGVSIMSLLLPIIIKLW